MIWYMLIGAIVCMLAYVSQGEKSSFTLFAVNMVLYMIVWPFGLLYAICQVIIDERSVKK